MNDELRALLSSLATQELLEAHLLLASRVFPNNARDAGLLKITNSSSDSQSASIPFNSGSFYMGVRAVPGSNTIDLYVQPQTFNANGVHAVACWAVQMVAALRNQDPMEALTRFVQYLPNE